ncbi:MAG: carbohydrate ABC transporter permease [Acetanaerobacterium sp.]
MKNKSLGSTVADILIYTFLIVVMIIMVAPFWNIVVSSFAPNSEIVSNPFLLFSKRFTLDAYKNIFGSGMTTIRALGVSIWVTAVSTIISMVLTTTTAYALSFRYLFGRKYILGGIIFTMIFNPGIIAYYLAFQGYGMMDKYISIILPNAISVFYLLLMKNFFQQIPEEMKEAATIDGCSLLGIFARIILPLSKPALATFTLFYMVDRWNSYFDAMMYLSTPSKWPITVLLRQIVMMSQSSNIEEVVISPVALRMATIVIAVVPILGVYPFLQKYFQSGLMAGSIKG